MKALTDSLSLLKPMIEPLIMAVCLAVLLWGIHRYLVAHAGKTGKPGSFQRRLVMLVLTGLCGVMVVFTLPITDSLRTNLLALLGIVISGVLGLSSTTLVANAMAGFMLRSVNSFHSGDFIRVGTYFGRVTERDLFHTEIQTEDRDLTTLPNLYLITNPVTVVRSSGTIISASLSLGYDVAHGQVEPLLLQAARQSGLEDPFVRVMELGNFSITYRVSGFLTDVKQLLTARSALNVQVLETLHSHKIEIMSPNFMTQRQLARGVRVIPSAEESHLPAAPAQPQVSPEDLIFDKAEQAEQIEKLRREREALGKELEEMEKSRNEAQESLRPPIEAAMARKRERMERLDQFLKAQSE